SFALSVSASTLSGFALGTLVHQQTRSPFLTAVSMYGATFATVLGALTLLSVADGSRPRRTPVVLQGVASAGAAAQAVLGLPLTARFGLLAILGFFQSLGTGNWLPAPEGSFNVFLRLYWPDEAALGGAWNPPPLRRTSCAGHGSGPRAVRRARVAARPRRAPAGRQRAGAARPAGSDRSEGPRSSGDRCSHHCGPLHNSAFILLLAARNGVRQGMAFLLS